MALTTLVGAPQCERGENQHLSNCGRTWVQERLPGGICVPAPLCLLAPLPVPSFIAAPVLPPSAPSCPPETQTGYPELLQRSELPPPHADPGEKQEGAGPGPSGGAVPAGGVVSQQHLPSMQKVGAPGGQGQAPSGRGALGRSGVVLLTYVLAALELTCLFMQFSIMPYLSRRLGLDSVAFGYQQTMFGVLQLLGGPVFGRFADQHGARAAFTLSFLASSALYLLLAAACIPALPGVALLFASRLPGALMHTLPAAQMVIADLSTPEERPAALGRLGLCFGVGLIFGPLLGGTLSSWCGSPQIHSIPALTFQGIPLASQFHPEPRPAVAGSRGIPRREAGTLGGWPPGAQPSLASEESPRPGVLGVRRENRLPSVQPLVLQASPGPRPTPVPGRARPTGLFMVMFSIISMDFFQLEAAQAGYLMSFFGILQMVIQGLVIGRLSSHFSEGALLRASVLVFSVVGLAMALMTNVFHFCLLMPGLVFSLCALNVVTDSILTKAVSASDTGAMLGLCASVQPLTRTLGPTLGGLLYRSFGVPVFGHVQFAVNLVVLLVLWRQPVPRKMDKAQ
ncbi:hypothetical protein FD754_000972 [Muntiacus muntjak]|uniref:Major facilitator superfamily (MFS) profile domain-containing protein n=1 Tax=Muntiacus muntjak TaxID=9888 RepID=A0A5N3W8Y3_MUNMU|nr:hypothetical protein FD754_000972 [Muntiacus muntjak]